MQKPEELQAFRAWQRKHLTEERWSQLVLKGKLKAWLKPC